MAADDITTLREELPEVFEDFKRPDGWDDYHVIPVDVDGDSGFELDESSEDIGGRIGQDEEAVAVMDPYGIEPASYGLRPANHFGLLTSPLTSFLSFDRANSGEAYIGPSSDIDLSNASTLIRVAEQAS